MVPKSVTLNGVISLILRYFTEFDRLGKPIKSQRLFGAKFSSTLYFGPNSPTAELLLMMANIIQYLLNTSKLTVDRTADVAARRYTYRLYGCLGSVSARLS